MQATGIAGALELGGFATAVATAIAVLINAASGVLDLDGDLDTEGDQTPATVIDWTAALDLDGDGFGGPATTTSWS